jgi:hypothetical protein
MVKVTERMPQSGGVGVALGYSSTLYSVTRLLGYALLGYCYSVTRLRFTRLRFTRLLGYSVTLYSVTRLLGYSSTLHSVTRPDARFWTTRAEPTSPGDTPRSVKNGRWNVATDSRQKTRFSAAVIDLTVARVWMPAHVAARSDAETSRLLDVPVGNVPLLCGLWR